VAAPAAELALLALLALIALLALLALLAQLQYKLFFSEPAKLRRPAHQQFVEAC
jgi:hypothetical protein